MLNEVVVGNYFSDLEEIIIESSVCASEIWNCDECGLNFEHTPLRVVAERGSTVVSKTSAKSSNLTVIECVNAAGIAMPSLIITKSKTVKPLHGFNTKDAPKNTLCSYQEKGWITDDIGEKLFNDVFLQHCGQQRLQLLIFDGHSSHESLAIIERALEENIILLSFPPHCTHYFQHLDGSVFGSFMKAYNEKCLDFLSEHPLHVVNKRTFPSLLTKVWNEAFTEGNIKSGFASCGIWPMNRHAISLDAYAPSTITNIPRSSAATATAVMCSNPHAPVSSRLLPTKVQATAEVRCIACEHIGWNETYSFSNVQYVYYLLQTKYNPACAQKNPRDRNAYEQDILRQIQLQQQQQQQQQQQRHFITEHNYRQLYDVREAFCSNQCTYVLGDVTAYFMPFGGSIMLNIHLRYCLDSLTSVRDGCYQRDTTSGFHEIGVKLQQTFEFLGGPEVVKVVRFVGKQCYCSQDFCLATASASCIVDSIARLGIKNIFTCE